MKFIKLFLICLCLMGCDVLGSLSKNKSLIDQDIRGDCNSMVREYHRALQERDRAAREYDYARFSGGKNGDVEELRQSFERAASDVTYLETEVLPLACSRGSKF